MLRDLNQLSPSGRRVFDVVTQPDPAPIAPAAVLGSLVGRLHRAVRARPVRSAWGVRIR